jgi:hypothetical protein
MNKAAAFQWDPNNDQTYSLAQDFMQSGIASTFSKLRGRRFTMDAAGYKLTLRLTPEDLQSETDWTTGNGGGQTLIEVNDGTLVYDASTNEGVDASLYLANGVLEDDIKTVLTVENSGQFIVMGGSGGRKLGVFCLDGASINVSGKGLVDMTGTLFSLAQIDVTLAQAAQLSIITPGGLIVTNGTVNVSSSPATGYSLHWVVAGGLSDALLRVTDTTVYLYENSTGFLRSPTFDIQNTNIKAENAAKFNLQSDSVTTDGNAVQFILGPGTAMMQFDGYSDGAYPFEFIENNPKGRYPQGMFNFTSKGTNEGSFVIRVGNAYEANAIVTSGFVAINGDVQTALGLVNATFDPSTKYATITQVAA